MSISDYFFIIYSVIVQVRNSRRQKYFLMSWRNCKRAGKERIISFHIALHDENYFF